MKAYNAKITIENINNHFKASGLKIEEFANLIDVSKRWLEYIFSGRENYELSPTAVQKACDFFLKDFGKFTTELQPVAENLREILKKKHTNNPEYAKILSDAPSVPFIIDNILVKDDEFISSNGMELRFIKKIILRYYPGLKLTNLSSDLQKSHFIKHWPHPTKKGTNLYSRKK